MFESSNMRDIISKRLSLGHYYVLDICWVLGGVRYLKNNATEVVGSTRRVTHHQGENVLCDTQRRGTYHCCFVCESIPFCLIWASPGGWCSLSTACFSHICDHIRTRTADLLGVLGRRAGGWNMHHACPAAQTHTSCQEAFFVERSGEIVPIL